LRLAGQAVLLFAPDPPTGSGYGRRLARLRWRRWLGAAREFTTNQKAPAETVFADVQTGVIVREENAIPAPLSDLEALASGRIVAARALGVADAPPVHTLREIEEVGLPLGDRSSSAVPVAVLFDPRVVPPATAESLSEYSRRVLGEAASRPADPRFCALLFEELADHPRPELVELLPRGAQSLCDVGCSAGTVGAAWKQGVPAGRVTGIESDSRAASIARHRLDRVVNADAFVALEALGREGAEFDVFLFGDILEHLEDPIRALCLARRLARPGARLVVSVPNIGHLSLVRDLIAGRFDPLPAGLADVGHLRWFSRGFLREALEEAGWHVEDIRGHPGAAAPETEPFLASLADWDKLDRQGLQTYQWIAVAVARE